MKHRTPAKLSVTSVSCRYHPVWYDSGSVREASNREREPGCCELVGGGGGGPSIYSVLTVHYLTYHIVVPQRGSRPVNQQYNKR